LIATSLLAFACAGATCERRIAVDDYPPGTLQVRFVPAMRWTDCLVAGVTMCANYVAGSSRLDPSRIRTGMTEAGLDPTRIADMRTYLAENGWELTPLHGRLSGEPETGLIWWVLERGYPILCVVNKYAGNADYNHAVVVIGFEGPPQAVPSEPGRVAPVLGVDKVCLLDPASPKRVECWDRLTFEHYWGSAGRIMLPLYEKPEAGHTGE